MRVASANLLLPHKNITPAIFLQCVLQCYPAWIGVHALENIYRARWSKTIVGQIELTAKLCLSFCLELQSAKSTYQHGLILMKHTAIRI